MRQPKPGRSTTTARPLRQRQRCGHGSLLSIIVGVGPIWSEGLAPRLPLSALYRLGAANTEHRHAAQAWLRQRSAVTEEDVALDQHVAALQQLLRRGTGAVLELAAAQYMLRSPLQVRRRVHLTAAQAGARVRLCRAGGEGACVVVRADGVRLSRVQFEGIATAVSIHNRVKDVELTGCALHGQLSVQKAAAVVLRGCTVQRGWACRHGVDVRDAGQVLLECCAVKGARGRGVNASGRGAVLTLLHTEVVDSEKHGVVADAGAFVRLREGCRVRASRGCGCASIGAGSVVEVACGADVQVQGNGGVRGAVWGDQFWECGGGRCRVRGVARD
jgi:hypothetical protein